MITVESETNMINFMYDATFMCNPPTLTPQKSDVSSKLSLISGLERETTPEIMLYKPMRALPGMLYKVVSDATRVL